MARVPAHDPSTGLLSDRAFERALVRVSRRAGADSEQAVAVVVGVPDEARLPVVATALAVAWDSRRDLVTSGRHGRLTIALLVRRATEPTARAWCAQAALHHGIQIVTRTGTTSEAAALIRAATSELDVRT